MSKKVNYRQCRLRKTEGEVYSEQTSYIPEPFCVLGKTLKLRDDNKNWDDGWKVVEVSSIVVEEIPDIHKTIRGHKKQTGDT